MKENTTRIFMIGMIAAGVVLVLIGLYLAVFTDISTSKGTNGIFTIAGFIAGGLFISVPAKIYLTLQLMKLNDERLRALHKLENN